MVTLSDKIKFNLGGHVNHSIYWENLAPIGQGGGEFVDEGSSLTKQIKKQFESYDNLIQQMNKKCEPIQGSGWGWLVYDNIAKCLRLV
jgi:Fe-Mn family superoxide dismutase